MLINEALRLLRVFHNLSQKDLARGLGLSQSYLSEIERDKTPTIDTLTKYSEFFSVPVSSIMFFSESLESDQEPNHRQAARVKVAKKILDILDVISAERAEDEGEKKVSH